MVHVVIVSDSHVPSREPEVPEWVLDEVRRADHAVHAGDYDSPEALEAVHEAASDLTAVVGNMDPRNLDVPEVATLDVEGVRFVVTHGTGPIENYRERVAGIVTEHAGEGTTVGVCGHTHQVMDEEVDGVRLLNPGSCTGADPATTTSIMSATVEDGSVSVTVHEE